MGEATEPYGELLSLSAWEKIDPVCDRFEAAWRAGEQPRIEDYLHEVDGSLGPALRHELLLVEAELRHRSVREPGASFGDYEQLVEIGRGAEKVVYRAWQVRPKRTVALAIIRAGASEADVQRFKKDADTLASLKHRNIVDIYEVREHEGRHYFTMPLMQGGSFADRIRAGGITKEQAAQWLLEVASGVAAAHDKGILHCDLKPANVMLDRDDIAHVTDFGLARHLAQSPPGAEPAGPFGTIPYMPPEQTKGTVTEASDIYGLGAILYELLTGQPPFAGASRHELLENVRGQAPIAPRLRNPAVDQDLEWVCLKCLQKDPKDRYASATKLAEDLEACRDGLEPPNNPRPTWWAALCAAIFRSLIFRVEVEPIRGFRRSNEMSAIVNLIGHTVVFAILRTGQPVALAWLAIAGIWVLMALNVWLFLLRWKRSAHPAEGYAVATYVGYVLAYAVLLLAGVLGGADPSLGFYPYLAVMTGLVLFIHGSLFWGPLYLAGLGYYALALVMHLGPEWAPLEVGPEWAPLEFAAYHCGYLILMSRHFVPRQPSKPAPNPR